MTEVVFQTDRKVDLANSRITLDASVELGREIYSALSRRSNRTPLQTELFAKFQQHGLVSDGQSFDSYIEKAVACGVRFPVITNEILLASARAKKSEIAGAIPPEGIAELLAHNGDIQIGVRALWRQFQNAHLQHALNQLGIEIARPIAATKKEVATLLLTFKHAHHTALVKLQRQGISRNPTKEEIMHAMAARGSKIGSNTFDALYDRHLEISHATSSTVLKVTRNPSFKADLVEKTYTKLAAERKGQSVTHEEVEDAVYKQHKVLVNADAMLMKINRRRIEDGLTKLPLQALRHFELDRAKLKEVFLALQEERGGLPPRAIEVKLKFLSKYPDTRLKLSTFKLAIIELHKAGLIDVKVSSARKAPDEVIVSSVVKARDYLGRNPKLEDVYETMLLNNPAVKLGKHGLKKALARIVRAGPPMSELVETSRKGISGAICSSDLFLTPITNPYVAGFLTYLRPFDRSSDAVRFGSGRGIALTRPDFEMQRSDLAMTLKDKYLDAAESIERGRALLHFFPSQDKLAVLVSLITSKTEAGEYNLPTTRILSLFRFIDEVGLESLNLTTQAREAMREVIGTLRGRRFSSAGIHDPRFYLEPLVARKKVIHEITSGFSNTYTPLAILNDILETTLATHWGLESESIAGRKIDHRPTQTQPPKSNPENELLETTSST